MPKPWRKQLEEEMRGPDLGEELDTGRVLALATLALLDKLDEIESKLDEALTFGVKVQRTDD